jgi:hypothetical protein
MKPKPFSSLNHLTVPVGIPLESSLMVLLYGGAKLPSVTAGGRFFVNALFMGLIDEH